MANGHGIFETVQSMFEDETVPQNVSNRLIMAAIIHERKDRECRDEKIEKALGTHLEKIERLEKSEKRWIGFSVILTAIGTTIASILGVNS